MAPAGMSHGLVAVEQVGGAPVLGGAHVIVPEVVGEIVVFDAAVPVLPCHAADWQEHVVGVEED